MTTAQPSPQPQPATAAVRAARVLLVEDNPVNLMVGQRLLSVLGITCDTASNGEAALLRMEASRYDIVLMDCQMPVMDGYTATRRWREMEEDAGDGRHVAIIAMTANAMAGDRQKCLDAGMDDYLAKPVTRSELERTLARWWNPTIAAAAPRGSYPVDPETGEMLPWRGPVAVEGPVAAVEAETADAMAASFVADAPASGRSVEPMRLESAFGGAANESTRESMDAGAVDAASTGTSSLEDGSRGQGPAWGVSGSLSGTPSASSAPTPSGAQRAVPPPQALPPVLDHEILDELRAMLGGDLDHLVDVFLADSPRLVSVMEQAATGPDYEALRDAAHSLKSSSANLGAMSLSAAAKRVELGARERLLERPAVAVALVANEFARARTALLATSQAKA